MKKHQKESQLAALQRRLDDGKTLTADQLRILEKDTPASQPADAGHDLDLAPSVGTLAKRLGINRQTLTWHRGRADAPQELSVRAWRKYLMTHGKGATLERLAASGKPPRTLQISGFLDGCMTAFEIVDNIGWLLTAALDAAGVQTTAAQRDQITVHLWSEIALRLDVITNVSKLPGSCFDDIPPAIAGAARRIGVEVSEDAPLNEMTSPAPTAKG